MADYMHLAGRLRYLGLFLALTLSLNCGDCQDTSAGRGDSKTPDAGECVGDCADARDTGNGDISTLDATPTDVSSDTNSEDTAPVCAPELACAAECCAPDQLCLSDTCVTPGRDCSHNLDCAQHQVCEPILQKCIPDFGVVCEYRPPTQVFAPTVVQAWKDDENVLEPAYNQVMMTPAVIDLNEDGIPDIIFSTFRGSNYEGESILRAIDGRTHAPIFDLVDPSKRVSGAASLAVGDLDGDGRNEIVAVKPGGVGLIVFDDYTTNWGVMWQTDDFGMNWDGAAIVDLDADGNVEIVAANRVYDAKTGALKCIASGISASAVNSIAVDLDGDGIQEVIAANGAFKFESDGQGGYTCPTYWTFSGGGGGYPAVGDFGTFTGGQRAFGQLDGIPEVVTAGGNSITLSNGQTGEAIWSSALPVDGHKYYSPETCNTSGIGTPTVADFDGDGAPEIGAAGACFYVVFNTDGTLLWKHSSQDFSSRQTGSSVFDFQGDGKAEVVYADECFLRVYDGAGNGDGTTTILYQRSHTSGTTRELPVIVDVDGDHHADIVFISNDYSGVGTQCDQNWEDFDAENGIERGIFIARDSENRWVSTRPVWNQHAYHVTNVCDGIDNAMCPGRVNKPGAIPIGQKNNWQVDYLNNFRQNVQGAGLFNAPDFELPLAQVECGRHATTIRVTIANRGSRGVLAGVQVAIWVTIDGVEQYLTTLLTTRDLLPGGREVLEYEWLDAPAMAGQEILVRAVADSDELGAQQHHECREDNNEITGRTTCACQSDDDCALEEVCLNTGQCVPRSG